MNKFCATLLILAFCFTSNAQDQVTENTTQGASVEKNIFNIQAGVIGFWISHEGRLGKEFTLRTEVGMDLWYYETRVPGSMAAKDDEGNILVPSISLEPRWYYNLEKRNSKGKNTANNSANFVTVAVEYYPDLFTIGSKPDFVYVPDQISIIPKWGIRRSIAGSNFNYELGAGIGYQALLKDEDNIDKPSSLALDLHIRIGYTF